MRPSQVGKGIRNLSAECSKVYMSLEIVRSRRGGYSSAVNGRQRELSLTDFASQMTKHARCDNCDLGRCARRPCIRRISQIINTSGNCMRIRDQSMYSNALVSIATVRTEELLLACLYLIAAQEVKQDTVVRVSQSDKPLKQLSKNDYFVTIDCQKIAHTSKLHRKESIHLHHKLALPVVFLAAAERECIVGYKAHRNQRMFSRTDS